MPSALVNAVTDRYSLPVRQRVLFLHRDGTVLSQLKHEVHMSTSTLDGVPGSTGTSPDSSVQIGANGSAAGALPGQKRGSALIKYDKCGENYDHFRRPVGMGWAVGRLQKAADRLRLPMHQMNMAALCCGTGQNEAEMLRLLHEAGERIHSVCCVDGSDGMLSSAGAKLSLYPEAVTTHQADVLKDELPFDRVHYLSCIQAVQHFEDSRLCRHFSTLGQFYRRVRQKLVRRGELFQIVSLPDQVLHSFWFYNAISGQAGVTEETDPAHHFASEHPPLERVFANLEQSGFRVKGWKLIKRPHFCEESYFGSPEVLFDSKFRASSSLFSIMNNRGLAELYDEVVRRRIDDGSILEHRTRVESARKQIGISIAISAEAV